jgi:SAM-dependent methyltransferase
MTADHFSDVAQLYVKSRPTYPRELFVWLAGICSSRDRAWDVGAGNGQASVPLADHFAKVVATDQSQAQIAHAVPHERIEYREAPAERSGLADASVDLVTIAQALHWFPLDAFYSEVRRVLKSGAAIAAWTYGVLNVEGDAVGATLSHFYQRVIGPYWPAERRHVENGYADLPFPFTEVTSPALAIQRAWVLDDLLNYCRSWSATSQYKRATGSDPVVALESELAPVWGLRTQSRLVSWPITIRAGRC